MRPAYLAAYDSQLRTESELAHAIRTAAHGPLRFAEFPGGRGFVTYAGLGDADVAALDVLVDAALAHFRSAPGIRSVEWKTRGHDRVPGLHDALVAHGFVPEETESIMIGEAALLATDIALPDGVGIRRARTDEEVLAMEEMQGVVFEDPDWRARAETTMRRIREDDTVELWIAVAAGAVVSAGRLEPVAGTEFAGLWGGATLPEWRGLGIYRALTAERARSALARGKRYLQSDSTEFSRPILERAGLVKVSTTTPYVWRPADD
ncbi:GNAT family N-acetyltransferase [Microbacterium sp. SD291]|uniref:GNAT family N-acetyltransferase n=1 Tax=Microbacterium sp. SD291 TaxID=2782007 RepID=UPI001A95D9F9|nr:GNAT family N-acetyltransferase [Microbacterium sp. SD291]MBO0979821.1 GNAT family N-acetyltransferase [Microbacterium sp. SD291]